MTNYPFAPAISKGRDPSFVFWENAFTEEELESIKEQATALIVEPGSVNYNSSAGIRKSVREAKVSWINYTQESSWLYDRMAGVASSLNAQFYNFDLHGFVEEMQFTLYNGEEKSHYTWHVDKTDTAPSTRKLSMVLQLSEPSDYEGGELQIWHAVEPVTINKKKGFIAMFPSYVLHRVTPVTKGVRCSLVVWVAGPAFK